MTDREANNYFKNQDWEKAANSLKTGLDHQGSYGRDRLLYLLDLGLTYRYAGRYDESNKYFFEAEKLSEISDYTSLSAEGATLFTSDTIKNYRAEDFEHLMINTYLAMNFAEQGKMDDALVEARKVNRKLYLMVTEGKKNYKQNNFARYLSGILYEAEGESSDAYIDYKKAYQNDPSVKMIGSDLFRLAKKQGMMDEARKWQSEFELSPETLIKGNDKKENKGSGEIIVLYENGISPIKVPHESFNQVPKFVARQNPYLFAEVEIDSERRGPPVEFYNIEATAIENLDEKYAGIIAKKIAGVVAKEIVGNQIERATDSPLLGFLTKIVFYASDQADLRSWSLLPRDLQIGKYLVRSGEHEVKVFANGQRQLPPKKVQLKAGQKVFVAFRSVP